MSQLASCTSQPASWSDSPSALQNNLRRIALERLNGDQEGQSPAEKAAHLAYSTTEQAIAAAGQGALRAIEALTWLQGCARASTNNADWLPDVLYFWHEANLLDYSSPWNDALKNASRSLTTARQAGCVKLGDKSYPNACVGVRDRLMAILYCLIQARGGLERVFSLYLRLLPTDRAAVPAESLAHGAWRSLTGAKCWVVHPDCLFFDLVQAKADALDRDLGKVFRSIRRKGEQRLNRNGGTAEQRKLWHEIASALRSVNFKAESLLKILNGFQAADWRSEVEWEVVQASSERPKQITGQPTSPAPTEASPTPVQAPARRRRRQAPRQPKPLTGNEAEAMQLVGEHKGNITAAASQAGKSRQAMAKLYKKACKKLGQQATTGKVATRPLATDRAGRKQTGKKQTGDGDPPITPKIDRRNPATQFSNPFPDFLRINSPLKNSGKLHSPQPSLRTKGLRFAVRQRAPLIRRQS